jgi:ferredoxin
MPRVTVHPPGITLEVPVGTTLAVCARKARLEIHQICEGEGICASCLVNVIRGLENLSPIQSKEASTLEEACAKSTCRLACQAKVLGDAVFQKGEEQGDFEG